MQRLKALTFKRLYFSIIFSLVLLLSAPAIAATQMPHFALPSAVDGSTIDSNHYHGQVLLVNFFATWCPPCRKEIPSFIDIQKEFGPQGLTIIGISTDDGGSQLVAKFIKKMKINYPVAMVDKKTPRNFGGILGIPTTFLINKKGQVAQRYDGYVDHNTLKQDISSIIH